MAYDRWRFSQLIGDLILQGGQKIENRQPSFKQCSFSFLEEFGYLSVANSVLRLFYECICRE